MNMKVVCDNAQYCKMPFGGIWYCEDKCSYCHGKGYTDKSVVEIGGIKDIRNEVYMDSGQYVGV